MIDASVWVGYFVRSDLHHRVTREWMARQHLHSVPLISWDDQQLVRAGALVPVGRPGEPLRWPIPQFYPRGC